MKKGDGVTDGEKLPIEWHLVKRKNVHAQFM